MSIDRYYDREFERDVAEADGLVDHLFEQSKKIVEAAGECWHVPGDVMKSVCGRCTTWLKDNPDLSLPENRHLLIGYVEKICDTDEKWRLYGGKIWGAIPYFETTSSYLANDIAGRATIVSSEAIMEALCRVIEETK